MGSFNLILDAITIIAGIYLIVSPEGAFNWGRKNQAGEPPKMPAKWPIISRVIGVVALIVGGIFIYLDFFR